MKYLIIIIVAINLTGCAISNYDYTPPEQVQIKTTKTVNQSFNETWQNIIENLTENSFVINNMSKDSGFLNISYSTSNADPYLNCGMLKGSYKDAPAAPEHFYTFNNIAAPIEYLASTESIFTPPAFEIKELKKLNGRINIYVKELDQNKSRIKTNVKYVLDIDTYRRFYFKHERHKKEYEKVNSETISFSSRDVGKGLKRTCVSTGYTEQQMLDYALR